MDDDSMIDRALRAYFKIGPLMQQPSRARCEVKALAGRYYVLLRNGSDTLAVYDVIGNPLGEYRLKGLKEVPTGLDD